MKSNSKPKTVKKAKGKADPAITARQQSAQQQYEATHPIEADAPALPVEAAPAQPESRFGDVALSATTMLNAEIIEKPEVATAIRSAAIVNAVNRAVEEYGARIAVAALQRALREACGQRQWVDETSGKLGKWTAKNANKSDEAKLLAAYPVQLAAYAEAEKLKAAKQAEQPVAQGPQAAA
jgi:hypothetical protein